MDQHQYDDVMSSISRLEDRIDALKSEVRDDHADAAGARVRIESTAADVQNIHRHLREIRNTNNAKLNKLAKSIKVLIDRRE
jgi:predicted  nucleic acid-binding Zn-ribbon protein